MWKKALLYGGVPVLVLLVVCILFVVVATVSSEDGLHKLDLWESQNLAGVAPGTIYLVIDGHLDHEPSCSLKNSPGLIKHEPRQSHEFFNRVGLAIPYVAQLVGDLLPQKASSNSSDGDRVVPPESLFAITWNAIKFYVDRNGQPLEFHENCADDINRGLRQHKTYCIVSAVLYTPKLDGNYGINLRRPCISYCREDGPHGQCESNTFPAKPPRSPITLFRGSFKLIGHKLGDALAD